MLQQPFITPWSIFTPIVYRMMERQYVDRFFETGELLISSFSRFKKHDDEERGDKEGWNILFGRGTKQSIWAVTGHGTEAYILCGTAAKDRSLMEKFNADAAIQIYNPTLFASVLSRHLPGVLQGFEGYCCYLDGSIECNIGDFEMEQLKQTTENNTLDLNRLMGFVQGMAGQAVFFKKATKFRHQLEYRFVWITDHTVADSIVISVPEARKLCAPLYAENVKPA